METIIVNQETIAKALKKADNGEDLTEEDKIILRNNTSPVNQDTRPRIYKRNRFGGIYTDLGNWNYSDFFYRTPSAYGETVRSKLVNFGEALKSISENPGIALLVSCKKPAVYQLYQGDE